MPISDSYLFARLTLLGLHFQRRFKASGASIASSVAWIVVSSIRRITCRVPKREFKVGPSEHRQGDLAAAGERRSPMGHQ